ncbi:MAG: glucose 1-dehydrogenase [Cyclobacteriaceae bacterium]
MNDLFTLKNKIALVTGASKGIGRACAIGLANAGADIALGFRNIDQQGDVAEEISKLGRKVLPIQMDMSDLAQIHTAYELIQNQFGVLDIVVNNVGVAPPNFAIDVTEQDFDHTLNINLKGTFFSCQAAGRIMTKQGHGKIINISSQTGFIAIPEESVYCMTKAGVNHLTRALALEWAPKNVRVNAIAPTFLETPGTEPWLKDPDFRQKVIDHIPMGRVGQAEEVVGAVVYLASDTSSLVTGEILKIDGGWTTH